MPETGRKGAVLCAIAAMAENRVIGRDNALIWHISEDLKYFKKKTMGKPMVMGRKSFQSLPGVLPGRPHIIITRQDPPALQDKENVFYVSSIEAAILKAEALLHERPADDSIEPEIFICGGGEIYRQTLPHVQRLYLTHVHKAYSGDTYFPALDMQEWRTVSETRHEGDPDFTFRVLERV